MRLRPLLTFFLAVVFFVGCKKDDPKETENLPAVTTAGITDLEAYRATTGGHISSDGGAPVTARGVVWSKQTEPTIALASKSSDGTGTGSFKTNLENLDEGSLYYVRAYATNRAGTAYGNEITFTAPTHSLKITTLPVTAVTDRSASSGGIPAYNGKVAVSRKGVIWSTNPDPNITLTTQTNAGGGTEQFSSTIPGLEPGTKYYLRAYCINAIDTAYGETLTFTTLAKAKLVTLPVSKITISTAISGGSISDDGGTPVTERGIVWSSSANPTTALPTKIVEGGGTGDFLVRISGLSEGVRYYVRAYCINAVGISYGEELSFVPKMPVLETIDAAIANQMSQHKIPGLSIAIVKDEKLVYMKSYGLSDREANRSATDDDFYRIASVSKPITAFGILKLVDDKLISLDQKVFGPDGILGNDFGTPPPGSGKDLITVRHLLEHKSGWTNTPNDPLFNYPGHTNGQIISDMLANRPLTYTPGSTYYYTNFGFSVLGRVIENVTKMTYETYLRNLLARMGITEMRIGKSTLAERFPKEVRYYQTEVSPYIMDIPRLDAAGGWVSSAKDLAKFMVRVDRNSKVPDMLSNAVINQYSLFSYSNWVHYGAFNGGTSAILTRVNNQFSFSVVVNTSSYPNVNILNDDLYNAIRNQINTITDWPDQDLFK